MSRRHLHVCLVTPGHLSTNPRLVKEADALVGAGYQVTVVCARFIAWADEADTEFSDRPWNVHRVAFGPIAGRFDRLMQKAVQLTAVLAYRLTRRGVAYAFHPAYPSLARAACGIKADLYIAHNLAALPAATRAARCHGGKLGFDAEDFHSGELNECEENSLVLRLTRHLEAQYLKACDYVTAASPGIARAYERTYGIAPPTVVLNVFPKSEAPAGFAEHGMADKSPSLYWFSQTIGPDRGLETAIEAIALASSKPTLFLRGNVSASYREQLRSLARERGVAEKIGFLAPAHPAQMIRLAAEFDLGLASESNSTLNRDICLTNKVFTYLLAGVPVLASDTSAQAELAVGMKEAVFVYKQFDAKSLAGAIDEILSQSGALAAARRAAWELGQREYNWDSERTRFLRILSAVIT